MQLLKKAQRISNTNTPVENEGEKTGLNKHNLLRQTSIDISLEVCESLLLLQVLSP